MPTRQKLTDESIRGLDRLLSSPHFMRLANGLWRAFSELRHTRAQGAMPSEVLAARLERLESRLQILGAKLDALESLVDRAAGEGVSHDKP